MKLRTFAAENTTKFQVKVTLLVVGASANRHFIAAQNEYEQRLSHYLSFEMQVIPDIKNTRSLSEEQQKQREGELIIKQIQSGDYVVLLDERVKEYRSVELADWLQARMNSGCRRLLLVVGGPYGFSQEVYSRANDKLSLSRLTFSHQMIRLIFTEQLYRAMTILKGEPYHHE